MHRKNQIDAVGLQRIIAQCLSAGKARVAGAVILLMIVIAVADWQVGNSVSLGVLYVFPMMLGGIVLRPSQTALLAMACAVLRWRFDTPGSRAEVILRSVFAVVAYFSSGLFVTALVRNRAVESQLRLLIESSPAAILTANPKGIILVANDAAHQMFALAEDQSLQGRNIGVYLPLLGDALQLRAGTEGFRTAAQCQGWRENGEIFLAHTWFSSHGVGDAAQISAIVVDSSEEMRDREEQNLQHLLHYNRITAAALAHEVRNISAALAILSTNLNQKQDLAADEDYQGLVRLTRGLEHLAVLNLSSHADKRFDEIAVQSVLDNLRIIIESEWTAIGGIIRWPALEKLPKVIADPNALLQSLLNLAQNSLRAVQDSSLKELLIRIEETPGRVLLFVQDSGQGVPAPERLFSPFDSESEGSGLGLYISRAIVRSFGGELRFVPRPAGCCFVIELQSGN